MTTADQRRSLHITRLLLGHDCLYVTFKATGNSRFETEKSPPAQRKIPENSRCLSSLIITVSAIPARFIWPAFPM